MFSCSPMCMVVVLKFWVLLPPSAWILGHLYLLNHMFTDAKYICLYHSHYTKELCHVDYNEHSAVTKESWSPIWLECDMSDWSKFFWSSDCDPKDGVSLSQEFALWKQSSILSHYFDLFHFQYLVYIKSQLLVMEGKRIFILSKVFRNLQLVDK